MYLLNMYNYSVNDFFDEMLEDRHNNIKNNYLKTRLLTIKIKLINAERSYKKLGGQGILHEFSEEESIIISSKAELDKEIPKKLLL